MRGQSLLFVKLMMIFFAQSSATHCDRATTAKVWEGNLGQSSDFNWLGVLKVHLHDGDKWHIAVSGIVLIKIRYALANADDVVRIPQRIFKSDSQAMFIAAKNEPWYVAPLSYVTHPEYEYSTFNSIAIIELNIDDAEDFPLNPICFPTASYNTSKYLYLTGFTDENEVLEKVIYKIQYLEKNVCEEFYDRAGLSAKKRVPTSYLCGYAPYNITQCVWDNGMALVSNATGWFNLIGFGVRGPGCAAPARFIDMFSYFSWINSVTNTNDEVYDSPDYRRNDDEFVPVHQLFTANNSRRNSVGSREYVKYPFDVDKLRHFTIEPFSEDDRNIFIYPFYEMHEQSHRACSSSRVLIYREYFELRTRSGIRGSTTYKLSMYDLKHLVCICVQLTVECDNRTEAILSFREEIDFSLGTQLTESGETPEEVFKYFPITERTVKPTGDTESWTVKANLKPDFIKQEARYGTVLNYDLYIKFEFTERALLKFKMFSGPEIPSTSEDPDGRKRASILTSTKRKKVYEWGMTEPNKMFKEPEATVVAAHEDVQETVSEARRSAARVLVVLGGSLVSVCSTRTLFINQIR